MEERAMELVKGRPFFCSWSGGKDSCLALYEAIQAGGRPKCLFTMMTERGDISRSHGLPKSLLEEQARKLGIPIVFRSATWAEYETSFLAALQEFRADGIEVGVFGDIDVESNREWCVRICDHAVIRPCHPLWERPRLELLERFMDLQFKARIVVANANAMGPEWLGRELNPDTIKQMQEIGIDASGELGEYHTIVTDGPIFESEIRIETRDTVLHEGYWLQRLELSTAVRPAVR